MCIVSGTPNYFHGYVTMLKPGVTIFSCYTEKSKNYVQSMKHPKKMHTMTNNPLVRSGASFEAPQPSQLGFTNMFSPQGEVIVSFYNFVMAFNAAIGGFVLY